MGTQGISGKRSANPSGLSETSQAHKMGRSKWLTPDYQFGEKKQKQKATRKLCAQSESRSNRRNQRSSAQPKRQPAETLHPIKTSGLTSYSEHTLRVAKGPTA